MIGDNKNILHSRGLVELHVHLDACEIHVHELQGHIRSNGTQQNFWKGPLISTAMLTPPDHSFTILDQCRPPESLLGESQRSSLTLMSSIPMNAVQSDTALVRRHHKCSHTLRLSFRGHIQVQQTFIQDQTHTVKSTRSSPSMCRSSNSRSKVSLFVDGISLCILSHFLEGLSEVWEGQQR